MKEEKRNVWRHSHNLYVSLLMHQLLVMGKITLGQPWWDFKHCILFMCVKKAPTYYVMQT